MARLLVALTLRPPSDHAHGVMRPVARVVLAVVRLLLAACATPYQPRGLTGSFL